MLRYIPIDPYPERRSQRDDLSWRNAGPSCAALLRQEITSRARAWAQRHGVAYECSTGTSAAMLFNEDANGLHGNFFPASYRRIRSRHEWKRRLGKSHTSARRYLLSHDPDRRELEAATSSDALLMSLFCHPRAFSGEAAPLRRLLGTLSPERLQFGFMPRIPLVSDHVERTEIDLRIGDLLLESKLTETSFQTIPQERLARYRDVLDVFHVGELPAAGNRFLHYQLLRGVLAANAENGRRYGLICDARRPDLIDAWYAVIRAVRHSELRSRLLVITWQEIAAVLPDSLQAWVSEKYGIV
jgi:hypothetical protein